MTGGNNVNTQFYRSVKVKMRRREMFRYKTFHKGLDLHFYAPVVDGINLLTDMPKTYDKNKIDFVDLTITARSVNPNHPLHERTMRDIDEELAMMDSKYRILKDHLKHTDNKELIHEKQPIETIQRHSVIEDHPYFDGANNHWLSKMQDKHEEIIPLESVKQEEKRWERRKALFKRNKVLDMKLASELQFHTGIRSDRKMAVLNMGLI